MTTFEQPEQKKEVPNALLVYEKLWVEGYGKTKPEDQIYKLQGCVAQLLEEDPEFESYLNESLMNFIKNEKADDKNALGWALINALSKRGKEFGLKVD